MKTFMGAEGHITAHVTREGRVQLYRRPESDRFIHELYWTTEDNPNHGLDSAVQVKSGRGLSLEEKAHAGFSITAIHQSRADVQRALARHVLTKADTHTKARENALVGELDAPLMALRLLLRHEADAMIEQLDELPPKHQERARGAWSSAPVLVEVVRAAFEAGRISPLDEGAVQILLSHTGRAGAKEGRVIENKAKEALEEYRRTGEIPDRAFGLWISTHHACPTMSPISQYLAKAIVKHLDQVEQGLNKSATSGPIDQSMFPFPAGSGSHRAMTGIVAGNTPGAVTEFETADTDLAHYASMVITWHDGEHQNLTTQLELGLYKGETPLNAVRKRYGRNALLHLQTAIVLHWYSWADPEQVCHWWPEVHLALQKDAATSVKNLRRKLRYLEESRLTVAYPDGSTEGPAPLLKLHNPKMNGSKQLTGAMLSVHPVFTRELKSAYWPTTLRIIQEAGEDDVAALASCLGRQFHAAHRRLGSKGKIEFRRNGRDLCNEVGINWKKGRKTDSRAGALLIKMFRDAEGRDAVGTWRHKGDPSKADTVWYATPSEASLNRLVKGNALKRPGQIPRTGDDLRGWMKAKGLTQLQLSKLLSVSERTIRRALKLNHRILPGRLVVQLSQISRRSTSNDEGAGGGAGR